MGPCAAFENFHDVNCHPPPARGGMIDPMSDPTLAPSLLLSMPQLDDPNFSRSVVLLCQHDTDGAFGLVLNRPVTTTARIVPQDDPDARPNRKWKCGSAVRSNPSAAGS